MGLVCYCLSQMDVGYCLAWALADIGKHAVELRLDDLIFDQDDIRYFMANKGDCPVVATYRIKDPSEADPLDLSEEDEDPDLSEVDMAVRMLSTSIIAGADYIDVDVDFPRKELKWLVNLAMNYGCKVILSYHNAFGTDSTEQLAAIATRCYSLGADIAKIVTMAHHPEEAARVLALYDRFEASTLVAFAMGHEGEQSRYDAFAKGMPLMYAAPRRRLPTSIGQPLFFDFLSKMDTRCWGDVQPPCAKSIGIRAIVAAALSGGVTVIENISFSEDLWSAISVARQLHATVKFGKRSRTLTITGHQDIMHHGLKVKDDVIDVGCSGLLCRLCIPLAALSRTPVTVTGHGAIMARKFRTSCPELTHHGVSVEFSAGGRLPAVVQGQLKGGVYNCSLPSNSQFASGLIMALPLAGDGEITLKVRDQASLPQVRLTADVISRMGIKYKEVTSEDGQNVTYRFSSDSQSYKAGRMEIEGDWSATALWLVLGVIAGESGVDNMRENSLQAESFILDILDTAGADIERYTDPEMEHLGDNIGYYSAFRSMTVAFECDISSCPDLTGPLLLLALRSEGISKIRGIRALGGDEKFFVEEFRKLGADIAVNGDELVVRGRFGNVLHGARVSSHGDHHLAMALLAATEISDGIIRIDDLDCIDRSWPDFPLK